jgi:CDP-glucose 4,6-dehydratase
MSNSTLPTVRNFYKDKKVAITGHTGFKGSWLSLWLAKLGAKCHGFSLPTPTNPSLFQIVETAALQSSTIGDIRDRNSLREFLSVTRPEIVFHLAAQALVRQSYSEPIETITTNFLGTAYLLEEIRNLRINCTVVIVTTDKCYENRGWDFGYRENDPMGGADVYSASKAACELIVSSWWKSFYYPDAELGSISTARAGNVIGGGDYAKDRIIPDLIRAKMSQSLLEIRNPAATRPWQHVLDCLGGYLALGVYTANQPKHPSLISFNFGPGPGGNLPVSELVQEFRKHWDCPYEFRTQKTNAKEAERLNLSIEKAFEILRWKPVWTLEAAVENTANWYRARHEIADSKMVDFSMEQIHRFESAALESRAAWL